MKHLIYYLSSRNLKYLNSLGSALSFSFIIQTISGIILSLHYIPHTKYAFISVNYFIKNEVQYGYLLLSVHSNMPSLIFILLYFHLFRNIYYKSYIYNNLTFLIGFILYLITNLTSFSGYILPWGQMSYWAIRVITNVVTVLPKGESLLYFIWGDEMVGDPLLRRIYMIHIFSALLLIFLITFHIFLLHKKGSRNLTFNYSVNYKFIGNNDINLYPYYIIKDIFVFFIFIIILISILIFNNDITASPTNSLVADSMKTPTHIVPEWYFLLFYAILKLIPNKSLGLLCIVIIFFLIGFSNYISKLSNNYFIKSTHKLLSYYRNAVIFLNIILMLYLIDIGSSEIGIFDIKFGYIFVLIYLLSLLYIFMF